MRLVQSAEKTRTVHRWWTCVSRGILFPKDLRPCRENWATDSKLHFEGADATRATRRIVSERSEFMAHSTFYHELESSTARIRRVSLGVQKLQIRRSLNRLSSCLVSLASSTTARILKTSLDTTILYGLMIFFYVVIMVITYSRTCKILQWFGIDCTCRTCAHWYCEFVHSAKAASRVQALARVLAFVNGYRLHGRTFVNR